jgi:hypothetical protein
LDKPLHVIYKVSKLAYRILVILIANERVKNTYVYIHILTASVVKWSVFLATDPEVRVQFQALPHFQ